MFYNARFIISIITWNATVLNTNDMIIQTVAILNLLIFDTLNFEILILHNIPRHTISYNVFQSIISYGYVVYSALLRGQ